MQPTSAIRQLGSYFLSSPTQNCSKVTRTNRTKSAGKLPGIFAGWRDQRGQNRRAQRRRPAQSVTRGGRTGTRRSTLKYMRVMASNRSAPAVFNLLRVCGLICGCQRDLRYPTRRRSRSRPRAPATVQSAVMRQKNGGKGRFTMDFVPKAAPTVLSTLGSNLREGCKLHEKL